MEAHRGETRAARFDAKHESAAGYLAGDAQVERTYVMYLRSGKVRIGGQIEAQSNGIDLLLS